MNRYTVETGRENIYSSLSLYVYDNELLERVSGFYSLSNQSLADLLCSKLNNEENVRNGLI